jgi:hypothetical protein
MKKLIILFSFIFLNLFLTADESTKQEDNYFLEQFANKTIYEIRNSTIVFDDGSEWSIGYWWANKLNQWQAGDQVQIFIPEKHSYYFYQLFNLSKNESVWSRNIIAAPNKCFANCLWIEELFCNESSCVIKLNHGNLIELPYDHTVNQWQPGDLIIVLKDSWNHKGLSLLNYQDSIGRIGD